MAIQTYNGLSAEQKTYFDRLLLERLTPDLVFVKYGEKKAIPRNEGDTINMRRFELLSNITSSNISGANEGVVPANQSLTISVVTAQVQGYGGWVEFSDFLDMAAIDKVITEAIEVLTDQASISLDLIVQAIVAAGTNVYYVGGHTARNQVAATDVVTGTDVRKWRRTLKNANVKPYTGRDYLAFIHPSVAYDVMTDSAWTNANQYAGSEQIFDGELGRIYGIRFIETTNAPEWAGAGSAGANVYGTLVIGKGAYAVPDIAGSSKPETIYHPFGSAGSSDPLNQQASAGWKAYLTGARLNENCILRAESSASS